MFGFVAPYASQVTMLKSYLCAENLESNVRTVDSWQGRECDYMIFTAVRCNNEGKVGFVNNKRRINVALTRAKRGLIIIGNRDTLEQDETWAELIDACSKSGHVVDNMSQALRLFKNMPQQQQPAMTSSVINVADFPLLNPQETRPNQS